MTSRLLALAGVSALGASLVACAADSTGPKASAGSVALSFASVGASKRSVTEAAHMTSTLAGAPTGSHGPVRE